MNTAWTKESWDQYLSWQLVDKKVLKKINNLIKDIHRSPFEGLGKPEPLKHQLSGKWARRITDDHRLIYEVLEDSTIIILSCKSHY